MTVRKYLLAMFVEVAEKEGVIGKFLAIKGIEWVSTSFGFDASSKLSGEILVAHFRVYKNEGASFWAKAEVPIRQLEINMAADAESEDAKLKAVFSFHLESALIALKETLLGEMANVEA